MCMCGWLGLLFPAIGYPFPYLDCLGGPQWEKRYLVLAGNRCPKVWWYPRVRAPLLLERGGGNGGNDL